MARKQKIVAVFSGDLAKNIDKYADDSKMLKDLEKNIEPVKSELKRLSMGTYFTHESKITINYQDRTNVDMDSLAAEVGQDVIDRHRKPNRVKVLKFAKIDTLELDTLLEKTKRSK